MAGGRERKAASGCASLPLSLSRCGECQDRGPPHQASPGAAAPRPPPPVPPAPVLGRPGPEPIPSMPHSGCPGRCCRRTPGLAESSLPQSAPAAPQGALEIVKPIPVLSLVSILISIHFLLFFFFLKGGRSESFCLHSV